MLIVLIIVQNRRVTQSVHYVLPLAGPQRGGAPFYVCNAEHIDDKGEHRHKNAKHTYEVEHCFTNYKYSWRHMASIYIIVHILHICVYIAY